jgi:hypothetical protein
MRFFITSATIIAIWACSAAQAQNTPKSCDMECLQQRLNALEQARSVPNSCDIACLEQRVTALEQARDDDRLTTSSIVSGPAGPYISWETDIPDPATLTPYISALNCRRTDQIVTVPSEDGGTRQINVRRC